MTKTTSKAIVSNAFNTKPCYVPPAGLAVAERGANLRAAGYRPRSAPEIADAMVKAMAGLPSNDTFGERVASLPDGRFAIPLILSPAGLELLACAAHKHGWKLHQFILDAAVCRAQEIREECRRKHVPFADFVEKGRGVCDEKTPSPTSRAG